MLFYFMNIFNKRNNIAFDRSIKYDKSLFMSY